MSLMNMAPSPEHDNEPKAPDKSDNKTGEGVELRTGGDFLEDHVSSPRTGDLQETSVSTLDDSQLKALLDEAITYKTPKDREGKSQIFKELLQEAEEDERNARAASASGPQLARYYNTAAARRHRNSTSRRENSSSSASCVSARLTHGGSLQDLAQPDLYADVVPSGHGSARRAANSRRRAAAAGGHHLGHHGGGHVVSVSARQREGGSLPSNVNAGATYDRQLFDTEDTSKCGRRKTTATAVKSSNCAATASNTKPTAAVGVAACVKDKKMVEATETAALTTSTATVRPEYTVVELGQDGDLEETRALLSQDRTPVTSYNSTSQCITTPPAAEVKVDAGANVATWSSDSDQQANAPAQLHVASIHADVNEERGASATANTGPVESASAASTFHRHQLQQQNALEEAIQPHRLPRLRYTSRATLELDGIGGAITTSNTSTVVATSSVDKSITFPQLHQHADTPALQLEGDYNSVRCIVESTSGNTATAAALVGGATGETQPARQQMTPSLSQTGPTSTLVPAQYRLLSVANPKLIHGVDRFHSDKKGLDENGNSVNTTSTALLDAKKKKKSKADRKVTVLSSEKIEGHRADIIESIDLLVKYIEDGPIGGGTSTAGKGGKPHHHHHHHHNVKVTGSSKQHLQQQQQQQQNNKNANSQQPQQQQPVEGKRRTRVKSKSDQGVVKKSNSLEEISKTKLEDLMADDVSKCVRARVKKQSTSEDGDRRSWGTEDGQQYICGKISSTVYEPQVKEDPHTSLNILAPETAEFHVVTKKKKSKKRRSSSGGRHNHHLFTGTAVDDGQKIANHTANHAYNQYTSAAATRAEHQHHPHHQQKYHQVRGHHHHRNSVFAQEAESVPARRKSACSVPPSDKSNDSSDVDSVHSLPAAAVHTHTRSTESAAGEPVAPQCVSSPGAPSAGAASLTSYADIARTSGGAPGAPVVSTSSASSNCSSHSGGSSGNMFIHQQIQPLPQSSWKSVQVQQQPLPIPPQQHVPPVQQTTPPAKNHVVLLRAEHFPELCETSTLDVVHRADDFPSLDQLQLSSAARVLVSGSKWTQVTSNQPQQPIRLVVTSNNNNCKEILSACQVKKEPSATGRLPPPAPAAAANSVTHKPPVSVQRQPPATLPPPPPLQRPSRSPPAPLPTDVKYCDIMNANAAAAARYNNVHTSKKLTLPAPVPPMPVQPAVLRRSHGAAPRPAVIILDDEANGNGPVTSSSDPIQVSGLTFGFELNEQLLNNSAPLLVPGGATPPRSLSPCGRLAPAPDKYSVGLVNNNSANVATASGGGGGAGCVLDVAQTGSAPGDRFSARYIAPQTHTDITDTYNHDKIVTYVGLAWEDVVHQSNGKVQYYNGQ